MIESDYGDVVVIDYDKPDKWGRPYTVLFNSGCAGVRPKWWAKLLARYVKWKYVRGIKRRTNSPQSTNLAG